MAEVLVVGGGLAGLATASALAAVGVSVTVIEAASGAAPGFRGELLHPPGVRALSALSHASLLAKSSAVTVDGFAVFPGGQGGNVAPLRLDYLPGGKGSGFDHGVFVECLRRDIAGRDRIRLLSGVRVDAPVVVHGRVVGVRATDGTVFRASLVVIADGRHSRMRRLVGIETRGSLLSYTVIASLEDHLLSLPRHGHVFLGGPGPVLAYPYGRDRVRLCIDVPTGVALGKERIVAFIRDRHAPLLPRDLAKKALQAISAGPLLVAANHAITVRTANVSGAVLVGDAGGCSHPLTATGMTSALNDAMILASSVGRLGIGEGALEDYATRRFRFVRIREAFAQAIYEIFCGKDEGTRAFRAGIFRYWHQSERARRASMAILSGDDSRPGSLLRELALVSWVSMLGTAASAARTRSPSAYLRAVRAMAPTARRVIERALGDNRRLKAREVT